MQPQENPMKTGRRFFLSGIPAMMAGTRALLSGDLGQRQNNPSQVPPVPAIPDASSSGRPDDFPIPPRAADPKVLLKEDQKALRRDVDHLLELAKDLKEESDKTPETDVLSLSLVKRAEEIEKLAHQIKDRIRAN
jgi:hypothetical protein